jgi:hypothetical protein
MRQMIKSPAKPGGPAVLDKPYIRCNRESAQQRCSIARPADTATGHGRKRLDFTVII